MQNGLKRDRHGGDKAADNTLQDERPSDVGTMLASPKTATNRINLMEVIVFNWRRLGEQRKVQAMSSLRTWRSPPRQFASLGARKAAWVCVKQAAIRRRLSTLETKMKSEESWVRRGREPRLWHAGAKEAPTSCNCGCPRGRKELVEMNVPKEIEAAACGEGELEEATLESLRRPEIDLPQPESSQATGPPAAAHRRPTRGQAR